MKAIKVGIIPKSTKKTLTELEEKQVTIETALSQARIENPVLSIEQIEYWILQFADTCLRDESQKQRLIDIFINSVYVYEDRAAVFLIFREGEVAVSLDEAAESVKKRTPELNPSVHLCVILVTRTGIEPMFAA